MPLEDILPVMKHRKQIDELRCGACGKFEECLEVITDGKINNEERAVCAALRACVNFEGKDGE